MLLLIIIGKTTSLIAACSSKTDNELLLLSCVNKLLDAGADPNSTDQWVLLLYLHWCLTVVRFLSITCVKVYIWLLLTADFAAAFHAVSLAAAAVTASNASFTFWLFTVISFWSYFILRVHQKTERTFVDYCRFLQAQALASEHHYFNLFVPHNINYNVVHNCLESVPVKEFWKLVNNWWKHGQK